MADEQSDLERRLIRRAAELCLARRREGGESALLREAANALAQCRRLVAALDEMEGGRVSMAVKVALKSARARLKGGEGGDDSRAAE